MHYLVREPWRFPNSTPLTVIEQDATTFSYKISNIRAKTRDFSLSTLASLKYIMRVRCSAYMKRRYGKKEMPLLCWPSTYLIVLQRLNFKWFEAGIPAMEQEEYVSHVRQIEGSLSASPWRWRKRHIVDSGVSSLASGFNGRTHINIYIDIYVNGKSRQD